MISSTQSSPHSAPDQISPFHHADALKCNHGFGEPTQFEPSIVPSIANTAGIGRFVYLVGHSQRRYVFSSINKRQVSLYNDAVFAVVESGDQENLWVGDYARLIQHFNEDPFRAGLQIYVHLLCDDDASKSQLIGDFCWQH